MKAQRYGGSPQHGHVIPCSNQQEMAPAHQDANSNSHPLSDGSAAVCAGGWLLDDDAVGALRGSGWDTAGSWGDVTVLWESGARGAAVGCLEP